MFCVILENISTCRCVVEILHAFVAQKRKFVEWLHKNEFAMMGEMSAGEVVRGGLRSVNSSFEKYYFCGRG